MGNYRGAETKIAPATHDSLMQTAASGMAANSSLNQSIAMVRTPGLVQADEARGLAVGNEAN